MTIYWNVKDRVKAKGWENAHQFAAGAGISYPVAWRILKGDPVDRIETATLERLMVAFNLKSPWSLLEHEDS